MKFLSSVGVLASALLLSACGGEPGKDGSVGASGKPGEAGTVGQAGAQGGAGSQGTAGKNGVEGTAGAQGTAGANGAAGSDGLQGSAGAKGDTGLQGIAGSSGAKGDNGDAGLQGAAGANGQNGAAGKTASEEIADAIQVFMPKQTSILDIECTSNSTRGTGTKLADGRILTAHHVLDGCTNVMYYSGSTFVGSGGLWTQAGSRDIITVASVNWNATGLALAGYTVNISYTPVVGELIIQASFPMDLDSDLQITTGHVTDTNYSQSTSYWALSFLSDSAAAGGSSGSPVFNKNGELFAIHVGGYSTGGLELNYQLLLR